MPVVINGTTGISGVDGSAGTPAFQGSDTNTGIRFGTDIVSLVTGGSDRLYIDSSGQLGVGTTSPSARLHLGGETNPIVRINTSENGDTWSTSSDYGKLQFFSQDYEYGGGGEMAAIAVGVGSVFGNGPSLRFYVSNPSGGSANPAERMRIDNSGRLLVGTSSTSGVAKLQVQGYVGDNNGLGLLALRVGSSSPADGSSIGRIDFNDSTDSRGASIAADRDGGTWGASSKPSRLVFSTTADGASSPTERARITNAGYFKATADGTYHAAGSLFHEFTATTSSSHTLLLRQSATGFSETGGGIFPIGCVRAATSAYTFAGWYSGNGTAHFVDREFHFVGDGNGLCDGSWTGGGADYAEYFEWSDSNPGEEDRRGISVVLDGDKIREAIAGEDPIGVISGNPSVVGDAAWNKWSGKYLRDEFGTYIQEDYEVVNDEGETVVQQRRKLNPAYDPDQEYIPREQRPEWDCVGLMGKLRIRKGQVIGSRWIKMRDISDSVEEWLVR